MKERDGSDVENNFLSLFNKENVNSKIKEKENKKINSARVAVSVQQRKYLGLNKFKFKDNFE
jgi:hypothetical protein